ncbi:hypothetical protein SAMN06265337_1920 [Hymenobacter gelipurpurascens]|uniref:Uncharacterized protein n=1 Tax=Hymenobacter gelipurpurascens TaxID=89968 RepID=A0A212TMS9_9BACT|nr:hypothetical protein [Hymenobacter gelipurpurascens]SNC67348.1 hypothetical protein SAMN06265337_1920 [Hymenobacter gelipurpurascens]
MSILLITVADFPEFWPLSINTAPELVEPYIRKAQTFDVRPLFTAAEWQGFESNLGNGTTEFPGVEFDPEEFLATPPPSAWDNPTLAALWVGFAKPVLVTESFRRLMLWHGTHVTPNGLETMQDINNQPVTSARRAELKADVEAERNLYAGRLQAALRAYRGTVPTTTCGASTRRRPGRGGVTFHAI